MSEMSDRAAYASAGLSGMMARLTAMHSSLDGSIEHTGGDEWTAQEILVHLVASNEILIPRVKQILVREDAPLPGFDERLLAEVSGYHELPATDLLSRIEVALSELVRLLARLPDGGWERIGIHESHGRISVGQIVDWIVAHTEEHVDQLDTRLR